MKNKKAAIWVSTVLYTVIGLAVIGILLAVARPKIQEMQDSLVIEQTINALNTIDNKILKASEATGTTLNVEFKLARGQIIIDSLNDKISFVLEDSNHQLSEENKKLEWGKIQVLTEPAGDKWKVTLELEYGREYDITFNGNPSEKGVLERAKTPYKIWIKNEGLTADYKTHIDISV